MRPSKITPLLVDMITKALNGGLSRAETAEAIGISQRTLYNWLEEGKNLYLRVWAGEIEDINDLDDVSQEKLRLFQNLHPEPEKTPEEQLWRIEALIKEKQIEKMNAADKQ